MNRTVTCFNQHDLPNSLRRRGFRQHIQLAVCALATAFGWVLTGAEGESASSGKNLAAGVKYTLWPHPNYQHCTDPGDTTQLTDAVRIGVLEALAALQ